MAKAPAGSPIFGINNRSMYTVPVGPVVPGLKALRNQQKIANRAQVTPSRIGPASGRYPNGKKVKSVN